MRFELWLNELPDLSVVDAKAKLAGFPKGLSAGVIIKALQDQRLPSVAVAFSEDLSVINEVDDRLTALGAECYMVDHAFFVRRIITRLGERIRRSRYRNDEDRSFIKLGSADGAASTSESVRKGLLFLMQLALVEGLFVWRLALDVGADKLRGASWFVPQLLLCAFGLLAATLLAESGWALRRGRLSLGRALPPIFVSVACTAIAVIFLHAGRERVMAERTLSRPPSQPFEGLLAELRRRDLAGERPVELSADAVNWDALGDETGDLLCLDRTGWDRGLRECIGGPAWDFSMACMPMPRPAGPPALKVIHVASQAAEPASAPILRAKVARPWGVTFETWDLLLVTFAWLSSLFGAVWFARRVATRQAGVKESDAAADPAVTQQTTLNAQVQALRGELSEMQAHALANENVMAEYQRQLSPAKLAHEAQLAEIARLREMLQQLTQRQSWASEPVNTQGLASGRMLSRAKAADQLASTQAEPLDRAGSSYSVSGGHEERIAPKPKR